MLYSNVLSRIYNQPHLIRPEKLDAICAVLTARSLGIQTDGALLAELRAANEQRREVSVTRSVAVLPILGTLAKRMDLLDESSGGTSTDRIGREFDRLMADDSVGAILLDVDSPGGEVFGVPELADKIFAARGRKPVEALVNAEMASGALWIGTAAERVSITPSGWVGSIGVYMAHTDLSVLNEEVGVKVTYIYAGDYKVEGNPDAPLTDEAKAYYQGQVDAVYKDFVVAVARNRRTSQTNVREQYGRGRMLKGDVALQVGLVDRIETFDDAINRLAGAKRIARSGSKAALERERLSLERYR